MLQSLTTQYPYVLQLQHVQKFGRR